MAEKEKEKKVAVYRSVSFKKLESWSANKTQSGTEDHQHKSKDLERSALPPPPTEAAAEKAQLKPARYVRASRKVSKISAASLSTAELKKGTRSVSPSIRQLSEKFSSNTGHAHASTSVNSGVLKSITQTRSKFKDEGLPSQKLLLEDSGYLPAHDKDLLESSTDKAEDQSFSVCGSVSSSDTEKSQGRITRATAGLAASGAGKRHYSQITSAHSDCNKIVTAEDEAFVPGTPVCKSQRGYVTAHGDTIHVDLTNWPSVTKIRELFGDGNRKQYRPTSDSDDLKSASHQADRVKETALTDRGEGHSPLLPRTWQDVNSADHDINVSSVERQGAILSSNESRYQDMDFAFSTEQSDETVLSDSSRSSLHREQLPHARRAQSPSSREPVEKWTVKLNSDPKPPPPAPPPRSSSIALPLRTHSFASGRQPQKREARQPSDSLHSWHSSSRPQAAPSAAPAGARLSSGEEEDSAGRRSRGARSGLPLVRGGASFSRNSKNGSWAVPPGRSSGSEEDSPVPLAHSRDNVRRRSLRKKKKSSAVVGVSRDDDGDSDDSDSTPVMEQFERHQQTGDSEQPGRRSEGPRSRPTFGGQTWERGYPQGSLGPDGYRRHYRGASDGAIVSSGSTPVPVVSRVSKVNISSFISSPSGSRSSSRYSSTETLKEEDQPCPAGSTAAGASSVMSKTYHGNFTMYRSPSFGHGDNFSRAPVRVRPRLPFNTGSAEGAGLDCRGYRRSLSSEKDKQRMSMSNPDIASETLTLLTFLKTDLSELRVRKKGGTGTDQNEDSCGLNSGYHGTAGTSSVYRMGSRSQGYPHRRPSLKDLTATLRRAKSFTYSEKPQGRQQSSSSGAKRSSSELRLDQSGDGEVVVSDREVESDDCQRSYGYEELMPTPLQDRYVQEAQQVIRDICQMGAQGDSLDMEYEDKGKKFRRKEDEKAAAEEAEDEAQKENRRSGRSQKVIDAPFSGEGIESEKCLRKGESDENVSYDKSVDELSGHESSLTDEGIVTEPESGSCRGSLNKDILGQPLTVWKQSGLYEEQGRGVNPEKVSVPPVLAVKTEYEGVAIVGESGSGRNVTQGPLEAPSTPSAIRRRRKFSSAGNNGSDSSNGSNCESNGETYRSLSDPMPHCRRSIAEDTKSFSVDSNLLGSLSLSSKSGIPEPSAADLSECTGSAASDLSVCSDGLRDYSTVIQSIVREPGTMDKLIDEKANGKAVKKKSFSDPSRRGESSDGPGFKGPSEPISELEQAIPPSSSEPILSEQRDELGELEERRRPGGKPRSQSERALPSHLEQEVTEGAPCFPFDPKLAEVLSPRASRRSSKKRSNRATHQQLSDPEQQVGQPAELLQQPPQHLLRPRPKHVRHASEPATFLPIMPPERHLPQCQSVPVSAQEPSLPTVHKPYQAGQAPSLEDVTKQYILTLNTADAPTAIAPEPSRSTPATPTTGEPRLPKKINEDVAPAPIKTKPVVDMRRHVMMTLLDTEQSYVESLRTLIQSYMKPLKHPENSPLCDPSLVDEMFYQIPEILEHHEQFLEQILGCVNDWHDRQTVGQLLIESFSKEILANIYSAYIDNFLNAKDAVRIAKEAKPAFLKFLEQSMRENKEKQALADLMIKPVQRIPRYELLVKDLLKHTPEDHPDHLFLLDAQKNIKRLAERINKGRRSAEEVERETRVMQEIEAHIEGVEHILNPPRKFLRQEMVVEVKTVGGKKDRSLFLFTDLLICTTLKRKSGSLRRSSMSLYTAASVIDTASKYKFLWKLPLEEVEMVKGSSQAANRENIQKTIGRLDEDLSTLGQISKLSETLSFPHQSLDDVIKDLMASVHRELAEKQSLAFSMTFLPTKVELTTASAESTFVFEFSSPDARSNFEQAFEDAKKKLAMNKDHWDPEFLKAIPIMKTRSGMQFSCASPSHSCPENTYEVWVCNSDGYVGQVCLLNIRDEPTVEACIAVCSARIICIAAVPGLKGRERVEAALSAPPTEHAPTPPAQQQLHISISGSLELSEPQGGAGRELVPFDSDDTDDEDSPSPSSTLQSQTSHSTISSSFGIDEGAGSKDMATETTSSEEEQEFPVSSSYGPPRLSSDSPMDGRAMRRSSRGSFTRASLEDLLSIDPEAYQSSVWLGTEDGCIHVYQSSDNIRNRKNSMKMQHSASILCILYLDNKVFVSLANGEVIVYQREAGSFWDAQSSQTLCLGTPGSPVTKMVPVAGKLWCGCQNRVLIINTITLAQEHSFQVGQDSSRCVTSMVSYGQGMWIALQGSAQVRLYHATTFESLTEVDVAPAVHKMLAGSDAIIRQHKAACLRITALLACKDLLWIGTSAGVVLTLAIPPILSSTSSGSLRTPLTPMGSAHGHTGHVRFLTSIELPEGFNVNFPLPAEPGNPAPSGEAASSGLQKRDSARRRTSTILPVKSNLLVISGGDGYEDFRLTNSSETVGRDDSTNHLLLWRV
ncbi:rho guanine nucleotide exchange factor 17-like [Anguilla rostrata]|uniref:rho guanine nucleotide exchange factor 17-like n=1 Tax=Anguilla rostrata TaxID=7938 RepID=UPI0030D1727A